MAIETMKQALQALRFALHVGFDESSESQIKKGDKAVRQHQDAITALHTAIAEAEKQEPVAWQGLHDQTDLYYRKPVQGDVRPLYTTPPAAQRQWVDLTDEQIMQTWEKVIKYAPGEVRLKDFARAIQAKSKENNHG